ncbi:DJ-1 family glyoxalase III [Stenotrophobium rhamnosiphilum]|uniref:DJ-1 family protein n=1 Tax=Stenotrophobium rhamnosiphilum TaxID=2029166 RepID=A0A2T5MHH7_9GAMM|nr:DJ-1 family glyoxalase III [Stenotrophobium rhamnosiphilum]PTU32014.1 DJ-1 family protein [Stenotrophobium rhamnosiphilum]
MKALVPIAYGSESLEAVMLINVLRRAGVRVTVASTEPELAVVGTRDITLTADILFKDIADVAFDLIVLPGGEKGAENLGKHAPLIEKLRQQRIDKKWYGAICAAPALTLSPHGLLDGKQATCYPSFKDKLLHFVDQPIVVDGHCITAQGPATALPFALKLVEILFGEDKRKLVAQAMLVP